MHIQKNTIAENAIGQRVDNYLIKELKIPTKSLIYKLIKTGQVRVNSKRVKPLYKLQLDDIIRFPKVSEAKAKPIVASKFKPDCIYENDDYLFINKREGMPVHGGSGHTHGIIEHIKSINPDYELGHRLDKATSGVLLICKNRNSLLNFHECLLTRKIKKTYIAIVENSPKEGMFTGNLTTVYENNIKKSAIDETGKEVAMNVKILCKSNGYSFILIDMLTGRLHQIRAVLSHLGAPILGDKEYKSLYKSKHIYLHALNLQFKDKSQSYDITAKPATYFNECLQKLDLVSSTINLKDNYAKVTAYI